MAMGRSLFQLSLRSPRAPCIRTIPLPPAPDDAYDVLLSASLSTLSGSYATNETPPLRSALFAEHLRVPALSIPTPCITPLITPGGVSWDMSFPPGTASIQGTVPGMWEQAAT